MPSLKAFLIYKIFVYLKTMAKPDDWALVDDLQEYVEGKVGTANPPIGLCTLETQI